MGTRPVIDTSSVAPAHSPHHILSQGDMSELDVETASTVFENAWKAEKVSLKYAQTPSLTPAVDTLDPAKTVEEIRVALDWIPLEVSKALADGNSLQSYTPFHIWAQSHTREQISGLLESLSRDHRMDRAIGCMAGMAVGD